MIEKVSGLSYKEFVKKNIFDPLKMARSLYDSTAQIIPGRAKGYSKRREGFINAPFLSMTLPYAAGSLLSTVDDLALWFEGLLSEKLISQEFLKMAWTPYKLADGRLTGYGYGWTISNYEGNRLIEHGGGINGFTSHLIFVPAEKLMVALLTNSDSGDRASEMPAFKIAALTLGKPYSKPKAISLKPEALDLLAGVYVTKAGQKRTITRKEKSLFSQRSGSIKQEIFPISELKFFFKDSFTRLIFIKDEKGHITGVTAKGRTGMAEVYTKSDEPLPTEKKAVGKCRPRKNRIG